MSKITAITVQANNKERCNVYVDGEFFAGVLVEAVMTLKLKPGAKGSIRFVLTWYFLVFEKYWGGKILKNHHGKTITLLFFQALTKRRNTVLKTSIPSLRKRSCLLILFILPQYLKRLLKLRGQTLRYLKAPPVCVLRTEPFTLSRAQTLTREAVKAAALTCGTMPMLSHSSSLPLSVQCVTPITNTIPLKQER